MFRKQVKALESFQRQCLRLYRAKHSHCVLVRVVDRDRHSVVRPGYRRQDISTSLLNLAGAIAMV